ncbi:MAG: hypothetical protein K9M02_17100 [Thiohalocapsa sp.]|nr:hypothetical protein [Thiohalocapsa sp.]
MRALLPVPALLLACAAGAAGAEECPGESRLEEALRLLEVANPVLRAEARAFGEAQQQRDWSMTLALGYDTNTTFETGAAGGRAALRVEIPLFDRTSRLAKAEARAAYVGEVDAARKAFLGDVQTLCELASQVRALDTLRGFARDRTAYRQERVNEGLDVPDTLWTEAEAMQRAEHDWQREAGRLDALRLTLARRWGGAQWQQLRALLAAMTQ